jgi:uncharacterized membrane protein
MENAWLSFTIVALSQLILFAAYIFYTKRFSDVIHSLLHGILMGIVVGLLSDLLLGKVFGLWSYTLGFGVLPLVMSSVFIYGLFASNILLLQRARFVHLFIWTMTSMTVYESTNYFFRTWTYEIPLPPLGLLLFLIIGYLGTAFLMALVWHKLLGVRFHFIDNLLKK